MFGAFNACMLASFGGKDGDVLKYLNVGVEL